MNHFRHFLVLATVCIMVTPSCEKAPEEVAVTSVSLNKSSQELVVGESVQLNATVNPSDATEKTITWSSSNPAVATVAGGKVTAIAEGSTIITASAGGKSANCAVTVKKIVIAVESVEVDKKELIMRKGDVEQLVAMIKPESATDKSIVWSSSDVNIVTVDEGGKVSAKNEGYAEITVTTVDGNKTAVANCIVMDICPVPESVDLGLTVNWASFNVGASKPDEYGKYYAWGELYSKNDYSWNTYRWGDGSKLTKYNLSSSYGNVDNKSVLEKEDDIAHAQFGEGWRLPTKAEQYELCMKCEWTWTTSYGVPGHIVTGTNGNSIFLPATGYMLDSDFYLVGTAGYYWSSSLEANNSTGASIIYFATGRANYSGGYRYYGFSVRAVAEQ